MFNKTIPVVCLWALASACTPSGEELSADDEASIEQGSPADEDVEDLQEAAVGPAATFERPADFVDTTVKDDISPYPCSQESRPARAPTGVARPTSIAFADPMMRIPDDREVFAERALAEAPTPEWIDAELPSADPDVIDAQRHFAAEVQRRRLDNDERALERAAFKAEALAH